MAKIWKFQVALGLFLSILLFIFSVGTIIAWNRYSPIIQEFIIRENIEKARNKSNEKNSKIFNKFCTDNHSNLFQRKKNE